MQILRISTLAGAAALALAFPATAQLVSPRPSPKGSVMQTIGLTDVTVTYSRPGVKGRTIWGGLVPYDKVWRTGANEATTISFSDDVTIDGQKLAAGTYSLHTIPGKDEWTIIFNKDAKQWGSYEYKQEHDALRVRVKPQVSEMTEWMMFSFQNLTSTSGQLVLQWEKLKVAVTIGVEVTQKFLASARDAVAKAKADDWSTPFRAGNYCVSNNVNLAEGMGWLEKSIRIKENFYNLSTKAKGLALEGKKADAVSLGEKAVKAAASDPKPEEVQLKEFEKQLAEWKAKK